MLEELKGAAYVVGAKQTRRALSAGQARKLFLAADADPAVTSPLEELARERGVAVETAGSMRELGQACAIAVPAAVAAILI